jgi:hypothetical protein
VPTLYKASTCAAPQRGVVPRFVGKCQGRARAVAGRPQGRGTRTAPGPPPRPSSVARRPAATHLFGEKSTLS